MAKETKKTEVQLLSWTAYPLETIYAEWCASRPFMGPVVPPNEMAWRIVNERANSTDAALGGEMSAMYAPRPVIEETMRNVDLGPIERKVREVFEQVITAKIPVAETIDFVFLIKNCPIALREQMVRHRIGHKFGNKLGVDIVPDIAESTWWGQTMRVQDMGSFYTNGDYLEPGWLRENGDKLMPRFKHTTYAEHCDVCGSNAFNNGRCGNCGAAIRKTEVKDGTVREFYHEQMGWIQSAYRRLCEAGMPPEDARNILPLGCQSDNIWKMNLSALMHVLSKRGCWIAQLGMWEPVINGLVQELATKVDPFFRKLIDPPCIGPDGNFNTCVFKVENQNRLPGGADPYPPCSLWVNNDYRQQGNIRLTSGAAEERAVGPQRIAEYDNRAAKYAQLWGRDPRTGEKRRLA